MNNIKICQKPSPTVLPPRMEVESLFTRGRLIDVLEDVSQGKQHYPGEDKSINIPITELHTIIGGERMSPDATIITTDFIGYPFYMDNKTFMVTGMEASSSGNYPEWKVSLIGVGLVLAQSAVFYFIRETDVFPLMALYAGYFMSLYLIIPHFIRKYESLYGTQLTISYREVWPKYQDDYMAVSNYTPWSMERFAETISNALDNENNSKLREAARLVMIAENRWRKDLRHPEDMM